MTFEFRYDFLLFREEPVEITIRDWDGASMLWAFDHFTAKTFDLDLD